MVLQVVWDAGGWNLLRQWPEAWPNLKRLMREGASVTNALVGSSPSVTPASHANMGTGAFPNQHGIVDIWERIGDTTEDSYEDLSPEHLKLATFADLFDRSLGNEPKVGVIAAEGWHLGMMGHGSYLRGGDKDIAVLEDAEGRPVANTDYYTLPSYMDEVPGLEQDKATVDAGDGTVDGRWMGHPVLDDPEGQGRSPVRTLYQTRMLKTLIDREGFGADSVPDLLFTNFKEVDLAGHAYNMVNPELRSILHYADLSLQELVRFLDRKVGKNRWVLVMTADHGQGPEPASIGGWGADVLRLKSYVADRLGYQENELFQRQRPTGFWLQPDIPHRADVATAVSNAILHYTIADDAEGRVPAPYADRRKEKLFANAFPTDQVKRLIACARRRG